MTDILLFFFLDEVYDESPQSIRKNSIGLLRGF